MLIQRDIILILLYTEGTKEINLIIIINTDMLVIISLTYLFRIKTKDKYLVKNARGIDKF